MAAETFVGRAATALRSELLFRACRSKGVAGKRVSLNYAMATAGCFQAPRSSRFANCADQKFDHRSTAGPKEKTLVI